MTILNDVGRLVIDDKQLESYFASKDLSEHTKIKSPSNYGDEVLDYLRNDMEGGIPLPFFYSEDKFKIRMGETTIVSGYSGHGKTAWLSYVIGKILQEHKCLIASFEMLPKATLGRMMLQCHGLSPTDSAVFDFVKKLDGKLYLYDAEGETTTDKIKTVLYYAKEKLGVEIFVIDSLMKCGINEDDYNRQKKFVNELCVASRDTGIHIFLVAHSRKGLDENREPSKFDVLGSSNITNLADNCITVFRNKKKEAVMESQDQAKMEEAMNWYDCKVYINKQRHGNGYEGNFGLYFDKQTFTYSEKNNANQRLYQGNKKDFLKR